MISKYKHIHFIGIGGAGMSALAEYFISIGIAVSGSDLSESAITDKLSKAGATIYTAHDADNLPDDTDLVVYTSAVNKCDNPELKKAEKYGIKTIKRAEMLGEIVNDKILIAVSGTHGKTTTTAMIGRLLEDAGFDPLVFVGGNVSSFGGNSCRYGKGKYAVVEADEYDRSFHYLRPDIAVITNIDEDHLDIYKDLNDIIQAFEQFCRLTKDNAYVIYFGDDTNVRKFIGKINRKKISYGFQKHNDLILNDFRVAGEGISYNILNSMNEYHGIQLNLHGRHNALNSLACFAVSKAMGIDPQVFRNSIGLFKTVDRRLQLKYNKTGIKVYDDYAHHPVEIRSTLNALRDITSGRIITVFQPHLYSRTKDFYRQFAEELSCSDFVILTEIYPAREKPIEGVNSELIFNLLAEENHNVLLIQNREEILNKLTKEAKSGDTIIFQGAGDINILCDEFISKLEKQN